MMYNLTGWSTPTLRFLNDFFELDTASMLGLYFANKGTSKSSRKIGGKKTMEISIWQYNNNYRTIIFYRIGITSANLHKKKKKKRETNMESGL